MRGAKAFKKNQSAQQDTGPRLKSTNLQIRRSSTANTSTVLNFCKLVTALLKRRVTLTHSDYPVLRSVEMELRE
jgi:hypothetical protein